MNSHKVDMTNPAQGWAQLVIKLARYRIAPFC